MCLGGMRHVEHGDERREEWKKRVCVGVRSGQASKERKKGMALYVCARKLSSM